MKLIPLIFLTIFLSACAEQHNAVALKSDEIVLNYKAVVDDQGGCRPTYEAITEKDAEGMPANKIYMLRGDTEYYNTENIRIGKIPLQVKMHDETISLLNEVMTCDQLNIKLVIEECQYQWNVERKDCPPILIKGQENFAGIEITYELKK